IILYNLILSYIIKSVYIVFKAQLVGIVDALVDLPFGFVHRLYAFAFSIFALSTLEPWARLRPFGDSPNALGLRPFFFVLLSCLLPFCQFKKDVSNSATQVSIMTVHNKTQLTHARINCILKDSSCDTPLSKILKLTILASNASSSSTKVFKCPHTNNDSIFTHNGSII
ncbi:hypothetical protein H5410_003393, partial [Solanum commersonii]